MNTTSLSLLERLRRPGEQDAWQRFVQLYTPLIFHWARRVGLPAQEAGDFVQDVMTLLVQKLPDFQYDRSKSFRGWLRTVTLNKWRELRRRPGIPLEPNSPDVSGLVEPDDANGLSDQEYREFLVGRALKFMQVDFEPATWKACWEYVVVGKPATEVARQLGITVNAVYIAKSRVLRRLRQELQGLLE